MAPFGYNHTKGGDSHPYKNEETRQKLSASLKGHKGWNKGIPHSELHRKHIGDSLRGKPSKRKGLPNGIVYTDEVRKKMSDAKKGKKRPREVTEKINKTKIELGQTVKVINLDTGKVYDSIREASRDCNVKYQAIQRVLKGERKTTGGYRWAKYE